MPLVWLWSLARCCCGTSSADAYCFGGYGGNSSPFTELRDLDGYFVSSDSWQARADLPLPGRQAHGATVLSGKGYAVAGTSSAGERSDNDEYTPAGDAWASRANLPAPRTIFVSAVAASGMVYCFGGFHQAGGPNGYLDYTQNDGYDPGSDAWLSKSDMPIPSRRSGSSAAVAGKVYSWCGFDGDTTQFGGTKIRDNDEYDPGGDAWASRTDAPLPARYKIQGGGSSGGKGHLIGGAQSELSGQHNALDDHDEYDPGGDAWASKNNSGLRRAMLAVTQTGSNLLHAFGGSHQTTFFSSSHQCNDRTTDTWTSRASLPAPQRTDAGAFGM